MHVASTTHPWTLDTSSIGALKNTCFSTTTPPSSSWSNSLQHLSRGHNKSANAATCNRTAGATATHVKATDDRRDLADRVDVPRLMRARLPVGGSTPRPGETGGACRGGPASTGACTVLRHGSRTPPPGVPCPFTADVGGSGGAGGTGGGGAELSASVSCCKYWGSTVAAMSDDAAGLAAPSHIPVSSCTACSWRLRKAAFTSRSWWQGIRIHTRVRGRNSKRRQHTSTQYNGGTVPAQSSARHLWRQRRAGTPTEASERQNPRHQRPRQAVREVWAHAMSCGGADAASAVTPICCA